MRKHILIASGIGVAAIIAIALLVPAHSSQSQKGGRSLREKAQQSGGAYVAYAKPNETHRYDNLKELAQGSAVVVIGNVTQESSKASDSAETFVVTVCTVQIKEALKGNLSAGNKITVRVPGGKLDFGNGSTAEIKMAEYWKNPELGKTYLFFLRPKGDGDFGLTGGPQGLFDISSGSVQPQVRMTDKLMQDHKDKPATAFLNEARQAMK